MNLIETDIPRCRASQHSEMVKVLDVPTKDTTKEVSDIVTQIAKRHEIRHEIGPTDHLVDSGMTSMAMVDLMLAIEAELDVMIPQREMTPFNFQSIESLAQMLRRMRGGV